MPAVGWFGLLGAAGAAAAVRWFARLMAAAFIARLIVTLGVGVVVFTGGNALEAYAQSYIASAIQGLPSNAYQILSMFGIFKALSIILAAYSMVLTWQATKTTLTFLPGGGNS